MKFIHIADVHLGAVPDKECSWSRERSQEIWDSFRDVIDRTGREQADLLLIAGDLFHRQPLMRELKEVNDLFSSIPDTKVVLIAGNHDYLKKDSYYLSYPWGRNVVCLWEKTPSVVYFEELDTYVYGLSYHSREILDGLYDELRPQAEKGGIHILLAHGGDETHIPIQKNRLKTVGFDYVALGHIHKPEIVIPGKMAYAGALEPIDRNDVGPHGFIRGECRDKKTVLQFVPFAKRSYVPLSVLVTPDVTQYSLEDLVREQVQAAGEENLFRISLKGLRDPQWEIDRRRLYTLGNIVDVEDCTRANYCLEALCQKYKGSLIGEYAEYFRKKERTVIEEKALQYGLEALLDARK